MVASMLILTVSAYLLAVEAAAPEADSAASFTEGGVTYTKLKNTDTAVKAFACIETAMCGRR
jgi:hypothetical protein